MAESTLASVLKQTHPLYSRFQHEWEFFADSYEGGTAYTSKPYLFRHARETNSDYLDRVLRATYLNLVRKQIDIYSAFIFKDPIVRDTKDQEFKQFEDDADRKGTSLDQIMSDQVGKFGMIFGHTVTVVDLPRNASEAKNKRQEKEQKIRPYVSVYTPLEVVNWAVDEDGAYRWLRVCEEAKDETPWNMARPAKPGKVYRTWTRDEWFIHDDKGRLIASDSHNLGEVPAVFTPIQEHLSFTGVGQSLISDTAPLARAIFNYQSLLDEFLYRQAFNILALPVDESMTKERIKELADAFGTTKGMHYSAKGNPPSYVSPPSDPAKVIMQRIEDAKRELIEVAKLQDRKGASAQKSGVAHAYEFHESNSTFAKIAKNLEEGEGKIIRLFYKWQQTTPSDTVDVPVTVSYPTDFNVTTIADTIDEALGLESLNVSPTFNKLLKKRVASEAFPGLDDQTEKTITDEIDNAPPDDVLQAEVTKRFNTARLRSAPADVQQNVTP